MKKNNISISSYCAIHADEDIFKNCINCCIKNVDFLVIWKPVLISLTLLISKPKKRVHCEEKKNISFNHKASPSSFCSVPVIRAVPSDPEWEHCFGNNPADHPGHPSDWRNLHVLHKVSTLAILSQTLIHLCQFFFTIIYMLLPLFAWLRVILFSNLQHLQTRMEAALLEVSFSHTLLQSHYSRVRFQQPSLWGRGKNCSLYLF